MNLHMLDNENEAQYIWRLCQGKDTGDIDLSWDEIANIFNKELGNDDKPFSESTFRKQYQYAKKFYDSGVFDTLKNTKHFDELKKQNIELEKKKVLIRDERNEYKRFIREQARKEGYVEQFVRSVIEKSCIDPLNYDENKRFSGVIKSDNDLVASLTDLHVGIEIDNFFNRYNENVLQQRLNKYLDKIFEVQLRHGSENVNVILSELVSGIIHSTLRIESNQNLIEQFLTAVRYISHFLVELSYRFNNVNVYMCVGNHSRICLDKEESMKGENIDHLAIPFLEAELQNFENIHFFRNDIEESVAVFNVRNKLIMASHGDKDSPENVVQKFTLFFNAKPDIIYLGHRHTNAISTVFDVKVIQSGCLSGSDNYCLDKRLRNKPEQTISVITDDGLDCIYDVKFD